MRTAAALVATALLTAACGGDASGTDAFCDATRAIVDRGTVDEFPPEVDTMVEAAPEDLQDAAETMRTAFEKAFEDGDAEALQTEEFQDAARDIREFAVDNCEGLEDISNE